MAILEFAYNLRWLSLVWRQYSNTKNLCSAPCGLQGCKNRFNPFCFLTPTAGTQLQWGPFQWERKIWGMKKIAIFWLKSPFMSETVRRRPMLWNVNRKWWISVVSDDLEWPWKAGCEESIFNRISFIMGVPFDGGTGISGLMRGLATPPPQSGSRRLQWSETDRRPQEDPLAVYCFCVCSGSALLGDLLGVSISRERDLSVLSIYPRFFLCVVFIVYCRILFCYMLMSVEYFGCHYLPHLFLRLAASVLWSWSWEKEGRTVEVVPCIYAVHWKFFMCTATRTSSYSPVGPSVFFCAYLA